MSYTSRIYKGLRDVYYSPDTPQRRVAIQDLKTVVFSDHHRGQRDGADDFKKCEPAYRAALAYYQSNGYAVLLLGDVEELWESTPRKTTKAYKEALALEQKFAASGDLIRVYGNHDIDWRNPKTRKRYLGPYGVNSVLPGLRVNVTDNNMVIGQLFFTHGHQGTVLSDKFSWFSRPVIRYLWRNIQRITRIPATAPSDDWELRQVHELAMYNWAYEQDTLILITGHTHHPVFSSQSHDQCLEESIETLLDQQALHPNDYTIQTRLHNKRAELEWVRTRYGQSILPVKANACYFNTGCCSFLDGDITAIELEEDSVRLVRWPDNRGDAERRILRHGNLRQFFVQCR